MRDIGVAGLRGSKRRQQEMEPWIDARTKMDNDSEVNSEWPAQQQKTTGEFYDRSRGRDSAASARRGLLNVLAGDERRGFWRPRHEWRKIPFCDAKKAKSRPGMRAQMTQTYQSLICLAIVTKGCSKFVAFFAEVSRNGMFDQSADS